MKKAFLIFSIILLLSIDMFAQSLAINTDGSTANASALLDVKSTDKGLLIPRMSKAEKNAIATPAIGLLIFQNAPDSIGFHYYNGTQWLWIDPTFKAAWKITGNSGTNSSTNFFGTTDNAPLSWRQNNKWLGRWNNNGQSYFIGDSTGIKTSGLYNIAIGGKSLMENTTGYSNIAIGHAALKNSVNNGLNIAIGDSTMYAQTTTLGLTMNVALGYRALRSNDPTLANDGYFNIAIGGEAMPANTTGDNNVVIGTRAMMFKTTARKNTVVGSFANRDATTGSFNSYVGYSSGEKNNGDNNAVFGYEALSTSTSGDDNSIFGSGAMSSALTSSANTVIGTNAMFSHKTGDNNVIIGENAAYFDTSGSQNVTIGSRAMNSSRTGIGKVAIGYQAMQADTGNSRQTAVGYQTLFSNQFGKYNVALGFYALRNNGSGTPGSSSDGSNNVALGSFALRTNTLGYKNVSVGDSSMYDNQSGADNTSIGASSLANNSSGDGNTAIGSNSGGVNITGNYNTYLGYNAASFNSSYSNSTAIGANAFVNSSNALILGSVNGINGATASVNVGIGTTTPSRRLNVAGSGTSGGTWANGGVVAMFENSANAFLQLSTPNGSDAGIYSGNVSTAIRSRIVFAADSSIYFSTGGTITRMTIDNTGQVGIGTSAPVARLDVDANFKLGPNGSILNDMIKSTETYDIPSLAPGAVDIQTFAVANVNLGSAVSFSPLFALPDGITISYARVSAAGFVEVKVVNAGTATQNPASMSFILVAIR